MKKILIANRGEIVDRISKTCHRMGIEVVTISSSTDYNGDWHNRANETILLEGKNTLDTYLNIEAIIDSAKRTGADAIHPGYGLLSESSLFAEKVLEAGLSFIGPRSETIKLLGNKSESKKIAQSLNLPVLDQIGEASSDIDQLLNWATQAPYPLMIKPVYGGGGKGMVPIEPHMELREIFDSSIRLNQRNFGKGDVILERRLKYPRHVEVQVLGDNYGNYIHLYTRECSLQRRGQKILEFAPAHGLSLNRQEEIHQAAVNLLSTVNYINAGTVEFLLEEDGSFYFLEVNPRIQVEHTVTEEILGIDIVEAQIDIARSIPLRYRQEELKPHYHSVQARIYAEDPKSDFAPSATRHALINWSQKSRNNYCIEQHGSITTQYDPMIGKVITKGVNRNDALDKLNSVLEEMTYFGGKSNLGFLKRLVANQAVRHNSYHTTYIDENINELLPSDYKLEELAGACYAAFEVLRTSNVMGFKHQLHHFVNPWNQQNDAKWRASTENIDSILCLSIGEITRAFRVILIQQQKITVQCIDGQMHQVEFSSKNIQNDIVAGKVDGQNFAGTYLDGQFWICLSGWSFLIEETIIANNTTENNSVTLFAKLPGTVVSIVSKGTRLQVGDTACVIEAMKMEMRITAMRAGTAETLFVSVGDTVDQGTELVQIFPD